MKKIGQSFAIFILSLALFLTSVPYVGASSIYAGLTEISLSAVAEATYEQTVGGSCPASYVLDDDLSTRWSSYGAAQRMPQAIQLDLGQTSDIEVIDLWWFGGTRTYTYDIFVTDTPTIVAGVFACDDEAALSSLTSTGAGDGATAPLYRDMETVALPQAVSGRYVTVRITEVTENGPAAIWEMRVWGKTETMTNLAATGIATATFEQTSGGNCPAAHAIDGNLSTRWSTYGATQRMPQAIQIDLKQTAAIDHLNLWWYGAGRSYEYDIYVTDSPTIIDQVFSTEAAPAAASCTSSVGSGDNVSPAVETAVTTVPLHSKPTGRYVTVLVNEASPNTTATLWEVQIMGNYVSQDTIEIIGFRPEADLYADPGTAADQLPLPRTVTAMLSNGMRKKVEVSWHCDNYDPTTSGSYPFIGTLKQDDSLTNTQNLTVTKNVILASLPTEDRLSLSLNDGWVFYKGALSNAEELGYDDSSFDYVDLPHTWNALDGADGGNDYYRGDGWYRRHLNYSEAFHGRKVYLYFEGVSRECTVYVNGMEVGGHRGAYTAFYLDITDYLASGDNLIAVHASNAITADLAPLSGDFTQYGGIYRDVSLVVAGETHIDASNYGSDGLFMTTTEVSDASATVDVKADVRNDSTKAQTVTIQYELSIPSNGSIDWIDEIPTDWLPFDPDDMTVEGGQTIHSFDEVITIQPGECYTFTDTFQVSNPRLWNGLCDPFRYFGSLSVICNGQVLDSVEDFIGFRTFEVDYDTGAYLNGASYNLRGASRHQDREGMGNALTVKEHNEDFSMIYEMGCNAVRLAHYPQADYFYNLCDQYGILVWAEIPFVNDIGGTGSYEDPDATRASFFETTRTQLKELIRQQYNHPSIIVWGIPNEVLPAYESIMLSFCEELADLCRSEDPTRLVTQATANASTPSWGGSELICTNLYPGWYYEKYTDLTKWINNFRSQAGGRPVGISEYGIGANYEQHCEGSPAVVCASDGSYEYEEYQSEGHESYLAQINQMDYLWCTFIWNMFDFGSDGRYEAQVGGINNKGMVSFDRSVKKDAFYLYKANWSSLPTLHLNSSRFTYRESDHIVVKGYSNCDSVSLYVNGELIGAKTQEDLDQETVFLWRDIALAGGKNTVKLVGTINGKVYADEVEWYYVNIDSPLYTVRDSNQTIVLADVPSNIEDIANNILCNIGATRTVYAADGETVLTEGLVAEGMKLCVSTEYGDFWYTFQRNNLALNATAQATYQQSICPAEYAIDGYESTRWSSYGSTSLPQGIQVDLGQSYGLSTVEILWFGEGRTYQYDVYVTETPFLMSGAYPTPTLSGRSSTGYGSAAGLPDHVEYDIIPLPASTKGRYVTVVVTGGAGLANTVAMWELGVYRLNFDLEKIQSVIDSIDSIGEVTADNYSDKLASIEAAQSAADALADTYGEEILNEVSNIELLSKAREDYDRYVRDSQYTLGDVNCDGSIDALDALIILQHSVHLTTLEGDDFNAADVNHDGNIDASDALLVLQYSVKIIDQF